MRKERAFMVRIGNFLFHYRNALFPLAYLLLFIPSAKIFPSDALALGLGLTLAIAGQIIRFLSIGLVYVIRGGRKRRVYAEDLVTDGLFAHCRNPLYAGNLLIIFGVGLAANALIFLLAAGAFFTFAYHAITMAEEDYLGRKFGGAYEEYSRNTPRFLFRLAGIANTLRRHRFHWRRLLVKEYGSTFLWVAGLIVFLLLRDYRTNCLQNSAPLFIALALAVLAYGLARFLKKSGLVKGG